MPEIGKNWEGQLVERRFLLRQYLGGTTSSAVFLTESGPNREKAAIKLIPASLVDPAQQLARWEAASRLSHPNILRLHEFGTCHLGDTALLFVVMDYADEALSQILPERPLAPTEVLAMLPPVLEALQFLHRHGFVHGRIRPSNILAAGDRLQLSSDGIVPVGERKNPPARPDAHDAPETLQGALTAAADVWSIGATVVEALTQKTPVVPDAEQGDPDVPPTLPAPFLMIARNCLRRDPGRRSTITAITDRLQPANATQPRPVPRPAKPVVAKAPSAHATSAKAAPSKSYLLPVIVITLLLVAGVAGLRYLLRPSVAQPSAPSTASTEKPPVAAPAPPPSPKPSAATPSSASSPVRARRSAGVTAQGAVLNQVLPDVPQSAVHTITGHFRITVKITADATGKVTDATLESSGPSQYFARKCVEAARSWTFTPPQVRDQSAPSEWLIHFAFSHSGIEPSATQTAP
jgi:TonB family protein